MVTTTKVTSTSRDREGRVSAGTRPLTMPRRCHWPVSLTSACQKQAANAVTLPASTRHSPGVTWTGRRGRTGNTVMSHSAVSLHPSEPVWPSGKALGW